MWCPTQCVLIVTDPWFELVEILYLLIPLSLILLGLIVWVFLWAINSGQFDDMEGPAHRILLDDETPLESDRQKKAGGETGFENGS